MPARSAPIRPSGSPRGDRFGPLSRIPGWAEISSASRRSAARKVASRCPEVPDLRFFPGNQKGLFQIIRQEVVVVVDENEKVGLRLEIPVQRACVSPAPLRTTINWSLRLARKPFSSSGVAELLSTTMTSNRSLASDWQSSDVSTQSRITRRGLCVHTITRRKACSPQWDTNTINVRYHEPTFAMPELHVPHAGWLRYEPDDEVARFLAEAGSSTKSRLSLALPAPGRYVPRWRSARCLYSVVAGAP